MLMAFNDGVRLGLSGEDIIDVYASQLRTGDMKTRLNAALLLGKKGVGDGRAVVALTLALRDPEPTIRGVAAQAIPRVLTPEVPTTARDQAVAALRDMITMDSKPENQARALDSYNRLAATYGLPGQTNQNKKTDFLSKHKKLLVGGGVVLASLVLVTLVVR